MEQHMEALKEANRVRLARAQTKREVKAGALTVAEILDPAGEVPGALQGMTIGELLRSRRQWGGHRARLFLGPFAIRENRPLGELTVRQRRKLCEALSAEETRTAIAA
jgi:hypothetical protein